MARRDALPGVVALVDPQTRVVVCTGAIVGTRRRGKRFLAYVLTSRHCVMDDMTPKSLGVAFPAEGDAMRHVRSAIVPAGFVRAPDDEGETTGSTPQTRWLENDWAFLAIETDAPPATLPVSSTDPMTAVGVGTPITLAGYTDQAFYDATGRAFLLHPHEHAFHLGEVPNELLQGGHSGAPVLRNGELIAVFSGAALNGNWFCGGAWPKKLNLVNIATIRKQAPALFERAHTPD